MGADLLELTGPPVLTKANGDTRVMPYPQNEDGMLCYWIDADTNYKPNADGSVRLAGSRYVRAGIQFGYRALGLDDATFLIEWLKDPAPIITPRTKQSTDPSDAEELNFEVRVLSDIPFTWPINTERLSIDVELEEIAASATSAAAQAIVEGSTIPGSFNGTLPKFVLKVDLTLIPLCSTLWDDLASAFGNLRVRDTVGNEIPFELSGNADFLNRSGYIFLTFDLDELSNNTFEIVATTNKAQTLPLPTAANGAHNVHVDRRAWHMEETPPADYTDSGSTQTDLTPDSGIDLVHGAVGLAGNFNPDEFTTEEASGPITFPGEYFLVEAWVQLRATAATNELYAVISIDKSEAGTEPLFVLERTTGNQWRFAVSNDANNSTEALGAGTTLGDWAQVAGAFYDDSGQLKVQLFIDGISISVPNFSGTRAAASGDIAIGARYDGGALTGYLQGIIDQVVLHTGTPVVRPSNLTNWIQARYQNYRPDEEGLLQFEAKTFKQLERGWYSEALSLDYFPLDSPIVKAAAHFGFWEDEIIIAGGGDSGSEVDTVRRYNFRSNTWENAAAMPDAIAGGGFGVIDGVLYVVGGWDGTGETDKTYAFNFQTGSWSTLADYPIVVNGPASAVLDGKLYVVGGTTALSPTVKGYCYDPVADSWTAIADAPAGRVWGAAVGANGRVLYCGGETGGVVQDDTYEYQPDADVWGTKAVMPVTLERQVLVNVGGLVYSFGGRTGTTDSTATTTVYYFDPINVWFTATQTIPTARVFHVAVQPLPGMIFLTNGTDNSATHIGTTEVYFFDDTDCPNTTEVRSAANLEIQWYDENDLDWAPAEYPGQAKWAAAVGWIDGRMYMAGGWEDPGQAETTDFFVYDPIVNRWIQLADVPVDHGSGPYGVIGTDFYVGADLDEEIWRYDTILGLWLTVPDMPAHVVSAQSAVYDGKLYVTNGSVMYVYDPTPKTWTLLATGPEVMVSPTVIAYRDEIYVGSGFPESDNLHRYNPATDSWVTLNNLPEETIGSVFFIWNDILFFMTGNDDALGPAVNNFYEYDHSLDSWAASTIIPTAPATETQNPAPTVYNDRLHFVCGFVDHTPNIVTTSHQVFPFRLQRI